jgi:hypothetical protein
MDHNGLCVYIYMHVLDSVLPCLAFNSDVLCFNPLSFRSTGADSHAENIIKACLTHAALVSTTLLVNKKFCIELAGLNDCATFGNKKGWNSCNRIRIHRPFVKFYGKIDVRGRAYAVGGAVDDVKGRGHGRMRTHLTTELNKGSSMCSRRCG